MKQLSAFVSLLHSGRSIDFPTDVTKLTMQLSEITKYYFLITETLCGKDIYQTGSFQSVAYFTYFAVTHVTDFFICVCQLGLNLILLLLNMMLLK